jgi:hypothetical protein
MAIEQRMQQQVSQFINLSEDQLLAQLGAQLEAVENELKTAETLKVAQPLPPRMDQTITAGPKLDVFKRIAAKFMSRFNRALYDLFCNPDDPDNKKVKEAVAVGGDQLAGVLCGILLVHFGWLPGIVVIVAALVAKRFVGAAYDTVCSTWLEQF